MSDPDPGGAAARNRAFQEVREAAVDTALTAQRLVRCHRVEDDADLWCTGSLSFPDADPPQDSWGDCAECGEPLIWVRPDV